MQKYKARTFETPIFHEGRQAFVAKSIIFVGRCILTAPRNEVQG